MGHNFHFVDTTRPDRASKRLARRHVMKGKNAGKTIHRGTQRQVLRRQHPKVVTRSQEGKTGEVEVVSPVVTPRYLGTQMLVLSTPVDLTAYSLRVINQFYTYVSDRIYPVQLGITLEDSKRLWLQLLVADEATHHCTIALLQACNDLFFHDGTASPEALHHLSQAYTHVKARLGGPDALSDSTIGLVIALAHQAQIGGGSQSKVHLEGLRRMVSLRGGIEKLEGNLPLTLKLCKTDVVFTLQYGGPTAFFRDKMSQVRDSLFVEDPQLFQSQDSPPILHEGLDPRLHEILADVLHVCSAFNGHTRGRRASLIAYQEIILSIFYRLLNFQPLEDSRIGRGVEGAYHAGLKIFMMTMFLQHRHHRFVDLRLAVHSLRKVFVTTAIEEEGELALWALVVGGIWIWDDPEGEWFAQRLRRVLHNLGLTSWDGAYRVLKKFPWIDRIHDETGRQAWERAHECS